MIRRMILSAAAGAAAIVGLSLTPASADAPPPIQPIPAIVLPRTLSLPDPGPPADRHRAARPEPGPIRADDEVSQGLRMLVGILNLLFAQVPDVDLLVGPAARQVVRLRVEQDARDDVLVAFQLARPLAGR